jgi:heme A synthase
VDRLLAQLSGGRPPSEPPSTSGPQRRITRVSSSAPTVSRGESIGLWARVTLGLVLGALMTQWPYARGCGWPLAAYLGAVNLVVLTGLWIAIVSWRLRSGAAHVLAFLLLFWGMLLLAERVLPRVGYAAESASWRCAAEATVQAVPYGLTSNPASDLLPVSAPPPSALRRGRFTA